MRQHCGTRTRSTWPPDRGADAPLVAALLGRSRSRPSSSRRSCSEPGATHCMRRSSCGCSRTGTCSSQGASWDSTPERDPAPRISALIAARLDTLTPDGKSTARGCGGAGEGVLGRRPGPMGGVDRAGHRGAAGAVTQGARSPRPPTPRCKARTSTPSGTCSPEMSPMGRSHVPRARPGMSARGPWIESKAPGRVEDLADVLAYHYATALDLARAAGETDRAAELEAPARRFLTLAGERALGLDTTAALTNLERALALTPPTHPGRPDALCASPRLPSTRVAPSRRRRRWSRRSHRSRSAAISPPWRTPCTCSPASSRAWPIHAGSSYRARPWHCWHRCRRDRCTSRRSPKSRARTSCTADVTPRSPRPSERSRSPTSSAWNDRRARSDTSASLAEGSEIPAASTTCARQSGSPRTADWDARWESSTTTSASSCGSTKGRRRPSTSSTPGSHSRQPAGSTRFSTWSRSAESTR